MKIFLFLTIFISTLSASAFEIYQKPPPKQRPLNMFSVRVLSEFGASGKFTNDAGQKDFAEYFVFLGASYETRYNITNYSDRASVSVGAPISVDAVILDDLWLSTAIAPCLDFNYGRKSTFNNIRRSGFSIGTGYEFRRIFQVDYPKWMSGMVVRLGFNALVNSVTDSEYHFLIKVGVPKKFGVGENYPVKNYNYSNLSFSINYVFTPK